jgi:hypothetical protein
MSLYFQRCLIRKSELYKFNPIFDDGKACGNVPVGEPICCWYSNLTKSNKGDIYGVRHPHSLKEAAILAKGAVAVKGAILSLGGIFGLGALGGLPLLGSPLLGSSSGKQNLVINKTLNCVC